MRIACFVGGAPLCLDIDPPSSQAQGPLPCHAPRGEPAPPTKHTPIFYQTKIQFYLSLIKIEQQIVLATASKINSKSIYIGHAFLTRLTHRKANSSGSTSSLPFRGTSLKRPPLRSGRTGAPDVRHPYAMAHCKPTEARCLSPLRPTTADLLFEQTGN